MKRRAGDTDLRRHMDPGTDCRQNGQNQTPESQRCDAFFAAEFVRILISRPASEVSRLPLPNKRLIFSFKYASQRCPNAHALQPVIQPNSTLWPQTTAGASADTTMFPWQQSVAASGCHYRRDLYLSDIHPQNRRCSEAANRRCHHCPVRQFVHRHARTWKNAQPRDMTPS